jgi:hypothetical protein
LPNNVLFDCYDRAGRGDKEINGIKIITPGKALKTDTAYTKQNAKSFDEGLP